MDKYQWIAELTEEDFNKKCHNGITWMDSFNIRDPHNGEGVSLNDMLDMFLPVYDNLKHVRWADTKAEAGYYETLSASLALISKALDKLIETKIQAPYDATDQNPAANS